MVKDFHSELQTLKSLQHPNVVQFLGASTVAPNYCLITELVELGSLHDVLHEREDLVITWKEIKKIATGICQGLIYLHETKKIMHRDIKSANVLIDGSFTAKIADMGLTRARVASTRGMMTAYVGTPTYMAPEMLNSATQYTEKTDVYSFGIILCELLSREIPYGDSTCSDEALEKAIIKGKRPSVPSHGSVSHLSLSSGTYKEYVSLCKECWDSDPLKRPPLKAALKRLENMK